MDGRLNKLTALFDLGQELSRNMRNNYIESLIPSILCIGGVYLMGITITTTMTINGVLLNAGIFNAMLKPYDLDPSIPMSISIVRVCRPNPSALPEPLGTKLRNWPTDRLTADVLL